MSEKSVLVMFDDWQHCKAGNLLSPLVEYSYNCQRFIVKEMV